VQAVHIDAEDLEAGQQPSIRSISSRRLARPEPCRGPCEPAAREGSRLRRRWTGRV